MIQETFPSEKTCFVIMGFGKKMDYRNAKEIDLDVIYETVIQKVFKERFSDYILIRADEIAGSQMIDVSMYALIMKADLVIADITTLNANALYELGIRHALKPYSTIIMMQENEAPFLPFDLNHNRILTYQSYDEKIPEKEAEKIMDRLTEYINQTGTTDSPMFTVLPQTERPDNIETEYQRAVQSFKSKKNNSIRILYEEARKKMNGNHFAEAADLWEKLCNKLSEDDYVIQQLALAQYKSKLPDEETSLETALHTMERLHPIQSVDPETLGICGAIYKRKYALLRNHSDLEKACFFYQKGYIIQNDPYNGENYAFCLLEKAYRKDLSKEAVISLKYTAKNIFRKLTEMLEENIADTPKDKIDEWKYATLSTSYYCIGNIDGYEHYRKLFYKKLIPEWEINTYEEQLAHLKELLS